MCQPACTGSNRVPSGWCGRSTEIFVMSAARIVGVWCSLFLTAILVSEVPGQSTALRNGRKAAIFVENRAGPALNDKVPVLEDFLTGRVTQQGFSVISREVAIDALNAYPAVGLAVDTSSPLEFSVAERQTTATGQKAGPSESQVALQPGPTKLDRIFRDSTSALRLAQNLGADYLLVASIASAGTETRTFQDGPVKTVNVIHTLRISYKVLEGTQGGSLIGDTIKVTKTVRQTGNLQIDDNDLLNELLDEAAVRVAANISHKQEQVTAPAERPDLVEIVVACGMTDLAQLPLSIPDVRILDDGTLLVQTNRLTIQVLNASVEIDGVAVGTAPGKFRVRPGLSKMRITREGFKDWERTVNFSEGQKFNVALQMSAEGYARWKDNTAFLFKLETGKKMTDGVVKMMEGFAQLLEQSGYRIDHRSDVKANIEAKGKSLFDGLTIQPSVFR